MAVSMGVLDVLVRANTRGFTASIGRATRGINAFSKAVTITMAKLAPLIAGASALVGIQRQFSQLDDLGKAARRIGTTTEALSALQHAAEMGGMSANELTLNMERLMRRVGQSAGRMDGTALALRRMGLSAEFMSRMRPEQMLIAIADGMQHVGTAAERTALSYQLFGRSGLRMLNIVEGGAQGLIATMQEAQRLGITPSMEQVNQIERANDAVARMRAAFRGLFQMLAIESAPFIEFLAEKIAEITATDIRNKLQGLIDTMKSAAKEIADFMQTSTISVLEGVLEVRKAISDIKGLTEGSAWVRGAGEFLESLTIKPLRGVSFGRFMKWMAGEGVDDKDNPLNALERTIERLKQTNVSDVITNQLDNIKSKAEAFAENYRKSLDDATSAPSAADWERYFDEIEKMASDAESWFEKTRTPLELAQQDFAELLQLFNAGFIDANLFGRGIEHIRKSLGGAADEQERMNRAVGQFEQVRFARTAINDVTARISAQDRMRNEHTERDPQLVQANNFLRGIFENTRQIQAVAG